MFTRSADSRTWLKITENNSAWRIPNGTGCHTEPLPAAAPAVTHGPLQHPYWLLPLSPSAPGCPASWGEEGFQPVPPLSQMATVEQQPVLSRL